MMGKSNVEEKLGISDTLIAKVDRGKVKKMGIRSECGLKGMVSITVHNKNGELIHSEEVGG